MQSRSLFLIVGVLCVVWVAGTFGNAQQSPQTASDPELLELLSQRRDTMAQRVELLEAQYRLGAGGVETLDRLFVARDELMAAELELVSDRTERLTIYKQRLDNMRALEAVVDRRYETGQVTQDVRLSSRAARLQAEIDLLRESR